MNFLKVIPLLQEVEALCKVYCGKDAESEQWGETCERFERLNRKAKALRRAIKDERGDA